MSQSLTLTEALNLLENGAWHSVAYVTADRNKKEGGRIVRIPECKIIPHHNNDFAGKTVISPDASKKQKHYKHATRNLTLRNGLTRKAHIHLLFSINNYRIL